MDTKSTIRAYQKVLKGFTFTKAESFSERFALERFAKKFQEPDPSHVKELHDASWADWINNDKNLPDIRNKLLPGAWYRARILVHNVLRNVRLGEFRFPQGSEFEPTRGNNSLEARLCASRWTSTYENFEAFSKLCYGHSGLKHAARKRYLRWFRQRWPDGNLRQADRLLWLHFRNEKLPHLCIFTWKLRQVTQLERGSRFSTVPKNNTQRRPINVECFANVLTQSQIGISIKERILNYFKIDLDTLQDTHRSRIQNMNIATIDLKNASDSISIDLCRFLLPEGFFSLIMDARSEYVLGLDGNYHLTKKISSMGNGFTFELMTLILTCIARVLDPEATVFGDDIIIDKVVAPELMSLLEKVGMKVNKEKSFWTGPFRESCGGNYHASEGYVRSFDFEWPTTIFDCVMIANKATYLGCSYPSFQRLANTLLRVTPTALQGVHPDFLRSDPLDLIGSSEMELGFDHQAIFPPFIVAKRQKKNGKLHSYEMKSLESFNYDPAHFSVVTGWKFASRERSRCSRDLCSGRHWAKYLMYLSAGRRCPDVIAGEGHWVPIRLVSSDSATFRSRSLKNLVSDPIVR